MAKYSGKNHHMSVFQNNAQDITQSRGQKARQFVVRYGLPIAGFGFLGSHFYNIYDGLNTIGDNPLLKEYNAAAYSFSSTAYLVSNWLKKYNIDGQRLGNTINLFGGSCVLVGACQENFAFMAGASIVALITNLRSSYLVNKKTDNTAKPKTITADPFVQAGTISTGLNSIYASETAYELFVKNNPSAPFAQLTWPLISGVLLARNIFVAQDNLVEQQQVAPAYRGQ